MALVSVRNKQYEVIGPPFERQVRWKPSATYQDGTIANPDFGSHRSSKLQALTMPSAFEGDRTALAPKATTPPRTITLARISHHAGTLFGGLPEGRGFSPAEIAAPALCSSRAPPFQTRTEKSGLIPS